MSRIRQNQNIDRLIHSIKAIAESRCSLSEKDLTILNEALNLLQKLKRKKGRTYEETLQTVVSVIELLANFFNSDLKIEV